LGKKEIRPLRKRGGVRRKERAGSGSSTKTSPAERPGKSCLRRSKLGFEKGANSPAIRGMTLHVSGRKRVVLMPKATGGRNVDPGVRFKKEEKKKGKG